jgi:membrane protein implicated in regulation of membrane protease activity
MNPTFDRYYRQLGRVTLGLLLSALLFYGITLFCAWLGLAQAAASFGGIAASLAYAFAVLLAVFLTASIAAAIIRWSDRRDQTRAPNQV